MGSRSLQDDLMQIPGVEGAEVEGSGDKPAGLRIRIAEGADQHAVGSAIRRVLTEHGLGTDTRLPGEDGVAVAEAVEAAPQDVTPDAQEPDTVAEAEAAAVAVLTDEIVNAVDDDEAEEASVIDLTDHAIADEPPDDAADDVGIEDALDSEVDEVDDVADDDATVEQAALDNDDNPEPVDDAPAVTESITTASDDAPVPIAAARTAREASQPPPEPAPAPKPSEPQSYARIESVSVAEGRDGIVITVTSSDGTSERQIAGSTEDGVEAAVVYATARLALPGSPQANVVDIEDRRIGGTDIVMIVLDVDGHMAAGSSVVHAGRPFALGRATWAALTH